MYTHGYSRIELLYDVPWKKVGCVLYEAIESKGKAKGVINYCPWSLFYTCSLIQTDLAITVWYTQSDHEYYSPTCIVWHIPVWYVNNLQVKFIQNCYHYLQKAKKPIILALTKCDEGVDSFVKEAEKFASAPSGRRSSIPIVETSAAENINVELAFMVLAQMIDKARSKSKVSSFATDDLWNLIIIGRL